MPVFYVPSGKGGFVLAMEHGFDDAEKTRRLAQTNALGFEDSVPEDHVRCAHISDTVSHWHLVAG